MALVTLQRSPTPSAASTSSTATTNAGEDFGSDDERRLNQSLSESFFMVKGAALFLQQGSCPQAQRAHPHHKHAGDLPQHLQVMINILRSEDRIKLAVRLESAWSDRVRYMVVVYTNGRQDTEENILLGMDFSNKDSKNCSVGMVLPLWSDTKIHLDGDGGFSVTTAGRTHIFKPVSVQAMWSALQILHKACEVSRRYNYFPGGMALTWMGYYESCISSEQSCINEWNAMQDLETLRPDSPVVFVDKPTERERTECLIKAKLRSIMMCQDLENVTSKEIRNELEQQMNCNLKEYKEFIDNEMLLILGQMDKATLIFDHLYLGSEWNASNLEELQESGVGHILNVTREIDNFFPGTFCYHNVRVYDDEATDLLAHWNDTYNFIVKAKKNHSKCLVHCKMGVSRSASTVIAYAMKEYGWTLEKAYNFVKQKRSITRPNASFMRQLAEYEGILDASKQRHNRLWRPDSDCDHPECQQAAGPCYLNAETGDHITPDSTTPRVTVCCEPTAHSSPISLDLDPGHPQNYHYYFRRLSDSALESEPSTPVQAQPLVDVDRVYIEVADVEQDALLEDETFEAHEGPPVSHSGEGIGAQTCSRGPEPLEELRLRLEFSTVEEEDEEEAQKEQAEMEALTEEAKRVDGKDSEELLNEKGIDLTSVNHLCNENNNNNHLKMQQILTESAQVKTRLAPGSSLASKPIQSALSEANRRGLAPLPLNSAPCISIQMLSCANLSMTAKCGRTVSDPCLDANAMSLGNNDMPESKSLDQETETQTTLPEAKGEGDFRQEETDLQGSSALPRNERELKGLEKAEASCSPQQQEALIQLQRSGLVRRRKERLEKLSGLFQERARANEQREAGSSKTEDAMNSSSDPADPFHRSFGTRNDFGTESAVPLTNEALLAVLGSGGLTPVSSPHGSTLTRSSSSDSLRSVRGKPGLVRQRTQEIEARMRLAGLTVPSRLKRSNSLAKLGSLTFSSEDLCSACSSDAGTLLMLSLSPEPEHSLSPEWAKPDNMEVFSQGEAGCEESKS
ncbi:protein phosphatase Slingshot homolog 1 isoform X1 [Danio rerio]|uniref:Protein phosphatase Slingshot homolog 1 n=1 Tax=Danio rerio TaxID=7955 RepID=A0A8M2BCF3_DANRE|nr:protein phosphatase Slingshot homolog 1 isoform X3 [Danio rerio]|eukprot:XP_005165255.1 protein phosphatase Slingshot homolog 1 isoform X3 [Danio rerio]